MIEPSNSIEPTTVLTAHLKKDVVVIRKLFQNRTQRKWQYLTASAPEKLYPKGKVLKSRTRNLQKGATSMLLIARERGDPTYG